MTMTITTVKTIYCKGSLVFPPEGPTRRELRATAAMLAADPKRFKLSGWEETAVTNALSNPEWKEIRGTLQRLHVEYGHLVP